MTCLPQAEHPVRKTIVSQGVCAWTSLWVCTERANLFHQDFCRLPAETEGRIEMLIKSRQESRKKNFKKVLGQNIYKRKKKQPTLFFFFPTGASKKNILT